LWKSSFPSTIYCRDYSFPSYLLVVLSKISQLHIFVCVCVCVCACVCVYIHFWFLHSVPWVCVSVLYHNVLITITL
jgi:hypothetical protein